MMNGVPAYQPAFIPPTTQVPQGMPMDLANITNGVRNSTLNLAQLKLDLLKFKMSGQLTDVQKDMIKNELSGLENEFHDILRTLEQ